MSKAFNRFSVFLGIALASISSLSFGQLANHKIYTPPYTHNTAAGTNNAHSLPAFNTLIVSGNVTVILTSSASNTIQFINNPVEKPIKLNALGNTLTISTSVLSPNYIVQLNIPSLRQLTTKGNAIVTGQLNSRSFNLFTSDHSQVNLTGGVINLQQVNANDNSQIRLYWVNSPNLVLNGTDNSIIKLAGVTQILHASLNDQAQLNGQYLRAQKAYVQTDNNAYVGISAAQALRAFASDDSNIFYYKYPRSFSEFSMESGNILQVDWRP